jgi:ACT domain-containing protein
MSKAKMKLNNVTVKYAREEDGKSVLSASITADQQKAIFEKIIEDFGEDAAAEAKWSPVKESDESGLYVKVRTSYRVAFYEDGIESGTVSSVDELGKGAVVDLSISIGESKFRSDNGFTAYLSAVNVHKFGVLQKFNPFA